MKYTQIPTDTFQHLQLNAGILAKSFTPSTGEVTNLMGATTGGINFTATPEFSDYGEDIDNCPKNMKELKRLVSWEAKVSGTYITIDPESGKSLVGAADIDSSDSTKIVPRNDLKEEDFSDVWWIGDYSDINSGNKAGFCAIRLIDALSTGGFQITSSDDGKGQFAFEYTAHYSMENQDKVPFEIYVKAGSN